MITIEIDYDIWRRTMEGNISIVDCKQCGGRLYEIAEDEPWHDGYYICVECDSTYAIGEVKGE